MSLINKVDQFNDDVDIAHQIVHGDSTTIVTTEGGPVRSLAKLIADKDAEFIGGNVVQQAVAALNATESAMNTAILARDAAMVGAVTYPDEATGRAAVADGAYFKVIGSGDVAAREYRRTNASTSVLVAEYPSVVAVNDLTDEVDGISKIVSASGATSSPAFIVADRDEKVLAQINDDGQLHLLDDPVSVQGHLKAIDSSLEQNLGTDAIAVISDRHGNAIASFDKNLELNIAGAKRSFQASVASNFIFPAMRYEAVGDTAQASYWYDRAENELQTPIRLDIEVAADKLNSSIQRIPAITKVNDGRLLYVWQQIIRPVMSDGEGVRLMQCFVDYDLDSRVVTATTPIVFDEPVGWGDKKGASMHPHLITLPDGKIICVFCHQDAPSGLIIDDDRNIYMKSSEDGGLTWTEKTKIFSSEGAIPRATTPGTTGDFIRIESGVNVGRLIFPIYNRDGKKHAAYSDDNGVTWQLSTEISTPGFLSNENSIAVRSDGSLIMNFRTEGAFQLVYATSEDDGVAWTFQGARTNWQSSNCASSMVQASETPADGFKKLIWSGLDNSINYRRAGLVLRVSHDEGITFQTQYEIENPNFPAGYSNVKMIAPNVFAVAWESGFNANCSVRLTILNLSEVYKNGNNY